LDPVQAAIAGTACSLIGVVLIETRLLARFAGRDARVLRIAALGNTAEPAALGDAGMGAGAGFAAVVIGVGAGAVLAALGASGLGTMVDPVSAFAPHSALLKSSYFIPFSVPPCLAAWYLVEHSFDARAAAGPTATHDKAATETAANKRVMGVAPGAARAPHSQGKPLLNCREAVA
jgi:hypothetical protein